MAGHGIGDFLDRYGLYSEEAILGLRNKPAAKVLRFYSNLYEILSASLMGEEHSPATDEPEPFKFMASASVRGESGCSVPECRFTKIDFLGRFAALYAESLILPIGLRRPGLVNSRRQAVALLEPALLTLLQLRPLIDAEVVTPTAMVTRHCEHEAPKVKEMIEVVHFLADEIAKDVAERFRIHYQLPNKSPSGRSTVYIEGPEDYLEHGGLVLLFDEPQDWRRKSWRYDSAGRVELKGPKKLAYVRMMFDHIATDTTFYLSSALRGNARYLTDKAGEAIMLDEFDRFGAASDNSDAMRQYLAHAVPILSDAPIASLLRIRKEQRDEFFRYREALEKALKTVMATKWKVEKKDVQELGKKISNELARLRKELEVERVRQVRRYGTSVSLLLAAIAIGAFGIPGVDHSATTAAAAFVGAGGGRLLGKALESSCDHSTSSARSSEFYFLLRIAQSLGVRA